MNLKDYIFKIDNFIEEDICKKVINEMNNISFQEHTFYNPVTKTYAPRSGANELSMSWDNFPTKKYITDKIWHGIKRYQVNLKMPWFTKWQAYSEPRFNKYAENKQMALHCDHIHSMFDGDKKGIPILSILGLLNDDFDGGEFVMFNDYNIELKKGDLLVFPSNFMYPHKVEPVTKGTRYSYISWVW